MHRRITWAAAGLLAACSFSGPGVPGQGSPDVDGGADDEPDASEVGADAAVSTCVDLPSGALAWWNGENLTANSDVLDQFPMTETFPEEGGPSVEPGFVGNAYTLEDDEDVFLDSPPQATSFTVEAWIRRTIDDPDNDYMTVYGNGDDAGVFLLDHKLVYFDSDGNNGGDVATGSTTIAINTFTHVAVTFNGTMVQLYVDGVPDGQGPAGGATINLPTVGRIGGVLFDVGDGDGNDFIGQVDELTVYDRALSATEIASIANAGDEGKCLP